MSCQGIRIALTDGATHTVDSNEMAFKLACQYAFRQAFDRARPVILEPIMAVEASSWTPHTVIQAYAKLTIAQGSGLFGP